MANAGSRSGASKLGFRSSAARAIATIAFAVIVGKMADGTLMYAQAAPVAEPKTEHVVPVLVHGRTVFITPTQAKRNEPFHWTSLLGYILILAAVAVEAVRRRRNGNET